MQLRKGMAAQATVSLEKAKRLEPGKASIREALGIAYFRIHRWAEAESEFRAVLETGGAALVVSQFTLIADTAKGNRPSFAGAARPEVAEPLYERFCKALRELGVPVRTGVFGARMAVELVNDGPVTIVLDVEGPS